MTSATHSPKDTTLPSETPPAKSNRGKFLLLLLIVVIAGIGAWTAWYLKVGRWHESTDDAYIQGNIVSVTPQTGGTVTKILVEDGMQVKAGQLLVQLDSADAQVLYDQSVANLGNTVRQVRGLFSTVDAGQAELASRQIALQKARSDVKRREGLVASGAISAEELAHARDELASAEAAVSNSKGQLSRNKALVDATTISEQPQVKAAIAQVRQAYLNLQRVAIVAPVDGFISQRSVQLGQRINSGVTLMSIIPLEQVWVEANFKETQLGQMRLGQSVRVHADLYGDGVDFQGKVTSLGMGTGSAFSLLPAQNASGNWIKIVQRVPIRIELEPEQVKKHPLRLGLSMHVEVSLHNQEGSVLPEVKPSQPLFTTNVFDEQLRDADALIEAVITANLSRNSHS